MLKITALSALIRLNFIRANKNEINTNGGNDISSNIGIDKTDDWVANLLNNIKMKKALK